MRLPRISRPTCSLLLVLLLVACAGGSKGPAPITAVDVTTAEQAGNLEDLYQDVSARLAGGELSEKQAGELRVIQQQVGDKLATGLAARIRQVLDETPRFDGHLPARTVEEQHKRLVPMGGWSQSRYQAMSEELSSELQKTRAAVAERQAQLDGLPEADIPGRLRLLEEMSALAGAGSPAQAGYTARRTELVATLSRDAAQAIEDENYEAAQQMLAIVQEVDPSDENTAEKLATVNTKVFEKNFWQVLERGDADEGYALLTAISETGSFDRVRVNLASSRDVMADYYASLGDEATKAGNVPAAYRRFNEARNIRKLLGDGTTRAPAEEAAFIKLVDKRYEAAKGRDQMGLAWGYLNVIKSMQSVTPALRRKLRETREKVLQRAIKRLSASPFENPRDSKTEFGNAVESKVIQHLFEAIPNDIRIIEREQLGDIMREKQIKDSDRAGQRSGEATGLAAADYLVQGTILEAKVDSIEKSGKKTMRVATEQVSQPNPDYNRWVNLSSKERDDTPEPPKTVMGPRKEDVTIGVTLHRKVGIFSVSYRVIDARSAKVIFADSVDAKAQYEDTSSEGVELGDFKLEFKLASLPSDIEILDGLADQVSEEVGTELAKVLAAPEETYRADADRYADEGNYEAAAQQYAFAIVLSQRKDKNVEDLTQKLRDTSIASDAE